MAPRPSKPVTSDVLEARDRLFAEGSTFLPVAREAILGIDGLVSEAERIIRYLANFQAYAEHGATIEAGTVFHGHPGVGKTLTGKRVERTVCLAARLAARKRRHQPPRRRHPRHLPAGQGGCSSRYPGAAVLG